MRQHTHEVDAKVSVVVLIRGRILGDAKEEEEWVLAPAPPSSPAGCARGKATQPDAHAPEY